VSEGEPLANGQTNGADRGSDGKFAAGNRAAVGRGNPGAADVGRHRARFFAALRDDDVERCLRTIRRVMGNKKSRDGDRLAAARELLDRVIGRAVQADLLERIEALEATVNPQEVER
jgi:hypothetical protein